MRCKDCLFWDNWLEFCNNAGSMKCGPTLPDESCSKFYKREVRMEQKLYTLREASKLLRVSTVFLYQKLSNGRLRSVRMGRKHLIPSEELERILKDGLPNIN
jgi:excisionase family DNA binding protein